MYATPNLTLSTTAIPILPSPEKRVLSLPISSRRRIQIKAMVSATATAAATESVRLGSVGGSKTVSLYKILGVKETASMTEIKSAYRSLAKRYHPDSSAADGRDFIEIHNAYETLSDPTSRELYDLSLAAAMRRRMRKSGVGFAGGYCPTRRWETDQCW